MTTMKDIRCIAWSVFWKTTLAGAATGFAAGFLYGFIVGFAGSLLGFPQEPTHSVIAIGGWVLGLGASFLSFNFFLARAIGKRIGDRQLQLAGPTAFGERSYAN